MLCQAGRYQASHLLATDYWPSIEALREDSGPFRLTFWKALQLHQYLHSLLNPQGFCRNMTTFEEYCSDGGTVLSKTYNLFDVLYRTDILEEMANRPKSHFTTKQQNNIRFSLKSSKCTKI